jgi:pyrroline-5-carboxylate reductase
MKTKSLGFIGGGRVTKIFLQAFANKEKEFESVIVFDTNPDVLNALKRQFPGITLAETASKAAKQEIVFIALHPPVIMETLDKISGDVSAGTTIISLAPKINLEKIGAKLPVVKKIVRVIPNATSYINEGYNPVSFTKDFTSENKQELLNMLELLGHTFEVTENKLESYAIMSAMLPTYFWFQWKELIEIGQKIGLSEMECVEAVYETLNASLDLMYKSELSPEKVIDLIPVKPIGEHEPQITEIYRTKLIGLFEKIKP